MHVYLETLGCRLNYAEMAHLSRRLTEAGHSLAATAAEADICVLNSCAVTGEAARKSRQLLRQLARANPGARLVVTGCYATLEGEAVAGLPNVRLVVGNQRKDELLSLMEAEFTEPGEQAAAPAPIGDVPLTVPGVQQSEFFPQSRTRAFVKVQDGCHNRCTFCIVTVARGEERSRAIGEVVAEINDLHATGYQEAVLTGVHLGAYGRDRGDDLHVLVRALLRDTNVPRLRLSSLEPFDLSADFFELWQEGNGRLMPHLHLPAQSGSDAILRRMARRNRVGDFEALVAAARSAIPGVAITTDLIVGFPGETEADFAETVAFARRMGFAHMHVFPYSARVGTAAARIGGQVPEAERRRRSRRLNELDVELARQVKTAALGEERPVLWEGPLPDASPQAGRTWTGLTDNYLRVRATVPVGVDLHNQITRTRLAGLEDGELRGELIVTGDIIATTGSAPS